MIQSNEIWKPVVGYEGLYRVSSIGNVYSEIKDVPTKWGSSFKRGGIVLKSSLDADGYERVRLYKNQKSKTVQVHRLVAMAFIDKVEGKDQVNHMNGKRNDNRLENLEWCTCKENIIHSFKFHGRTTKLIIYVQPVRITKDGFSLTFDSIKECREYLGASEAGFSKQMKKGRTYRGWIIERLEKREKVAA